MYGRYRPSGDYMSMLALVSNFRKVASKRLRKNLAAIYMYETKIASKNILKELRIGEIDCNAHIPQNVINTAYIGVHSAYCFSIYRDIEICTPSLSSTMSQQTSNGAPASKPDLSAYGLTTEEIQTLSQKSIEAKEHAYCTVICSFLQ